MCYHREVRVAHTQIAQPPAEPEPLRAALWTGREGERDPSSWVAQSQEKESGFPSKLLSTQFMKKCFPKLLGFYHTSNLYLNRSQRGKKNKQRKINTGTV